MRYSRKNNNHWRMRINLQGERGLCTLMECSIDCFSTIKEQWSQWRELGVNEDFLNQRWVSVWFHTVVCIIWSTEVLDFVYIIWGTEVWDFCNVCRSYQKVLVHWCLIWTLLFKHWVSVRLSNSLRLIIEVIDHKINHKINHFT